MTSSSSNKSANASPAELPKRSRSPLVKVDGVAALTGKSISAIYAMADGGDRAGEAYQWVWNVAANPQGKIRNLRFWMPEISDPKAVAILSLDEVIAEILPESRREFPAGTVCQMLQLRGVTLSALRGELGGTLRANCGVYPRAGLVKFFRTRWLGAQLPANHDLKPTFPTITTAHK